MLTPDRLVFSKMTPTDEPRLILLQIDKDRQTPQRKNQTKTYSKHLDSNLEVKNQWVRKDSNQEK